MKPGTINAFAAVVIAFVSLAELHTGHYLTCIFDGILCGLNAAVVYQYLAPKESK